MLASRCYNVQLKHTHTHTCIIICILYIYIYKYIAHLFGLGNCAQNTLTLYSGFILSIKSEYSIYTYFACSLVGMLLDMAENAIENHQ